MYDIVLADPPWRYKNGKKGKIAGAVPYETMSISELCTLNIPAKPNSILFLWATIPLIPEALRLMSAWGFKYKSGWIWLKRSLKGTPRIGPGYWTRSCAELILIGTRGHMYHWVRGKSMPGVIESIPTDHSRKPQLVHERIKYLFGHNENLKCLELFARAPFVDGWDVWGLEVPGFPKVLVRQGTNSEQENGSTENLTNSTIVSEGKEPEQLMEEN